MKYLKLAVIAALTLTGCGNKEKDKHSDDETDATMVYPPSKIGFGSCSDTMFPMPMFSIAATHEPELFLFLGDNIYGDTEDMGVLQGKYDNLGAAAEFQQLKAASDLLAIWDDHDYGANDAGKDYPMKVESRDIFFNFWEEPADSPRRQHDGIYHSYLYEGAPGPNLQIILLDTRWFRDDLTPNDGTGKNDYIPNTDPSVNMLGATQWTWLEEQLQVDADLRIIGSSNQFAHEYNGWESWTNLPAERDRLLELIRTTEAEGVMILSGDVHYAEISQVEVATGYTLVDATSSAISRFPEPPMDNANRIGEPFQPNNVGLVEIDWPGESVKISIVDVTDTERITHTFSFDDMRF